MTLENEQLSDLSWARQVLNGTQDNHDDPEHAIWITKQIAMHAENKDIATYAQNLLARAQNRCYLEPNTFCFLRAQQGKA